MHPSKYFNSKYMAFVGYETCDKLIWESGEGRTITNKIRKQGISKTDINKFSSASTFKFGLSLHKYSCDILS